MDFSIRKTKYGRILDIFFNQKNDSLQCMHFWLSFKRPFGTVHQIPGTDDLLCIHQGIFYFKSPPTEDKILYRAYGFTFFVFGVSYIIANKIE